MADVTGRNGYIISQALAIAVAVIPYLPVEYRALSDREDMLMLLRARSTSAQFILDQAAKTSHLTDRVDEG